MYKKIDIQLKTFHALLKSLSFKSQKREQIISQLQTSMTYHSLSMHVGMALLV